MANNATFKTNKGTTIQASWNYSGHGELLIKVDHGGVGTVEVVNLHYFKGFYRDGSVDVEYHIRWNEDACKVLLEVTRRSISREVDVISG